jgi:iron complex transport system ATP-binding protein
MDPSAGKARGVLVEMLLIDSLSVAYDARIVLKHISFEVLPGEILALIGPNGAGKSSLIRAASGVIPIESGRVCVNQIDLATLTTIQRAKILAVVPQARQMGGAYSVEQAVMMGRTPYLTWLGRESQNDRLAVQAALEQTSLVSLADRQIASLSGGEQQRVLLARALAQATPVLLLDEPTNHLDLHHQTSFLTLVKKLAKSNHLAVIMAVHDLNLVSYFAKKVALIVDGSLECYGSPQQVINAKNISAAYNTQVDVVIHPDTGSRLIFPGGMRDINK